MCLGLPAHAALASRGARRRAARWIRFGAFVLEALAVTEQRRLGFDARCSRGIASAVSAAESTARLVEASSRTTSSASQPVAPTTRATA